MSTNETSDETLAMLLQAFENAALVAPALSQCYRRLEEGIGGAKLDKAAVGDLEVLRKAMTAQRDAMKKVVKAMEDMVKALQSYRKGVEKNLAASELLATSKKAFELVEEMNKAEAAVKESLANIQDKAANVERKNELDEKVDGFRAIFDRNIREIAAVARRLVVNAKEFWHRGQTGEEEAATKKEAEGWRAEAQKGKQTLEVATGENQSLERGLGERIWAFEGVQVDYDRYAEGKKMYRGLEDKLEPPKRQKPDAGTATRDHRG